MIQVHMITRPPPIDEVCINTARGWTSGEVSDELYWDENLHTFATSYVISWSADTGLVGASLPGHVHTVPLPVRGVEEATVNTYRGWKTGAVATRMHTRKAMLKYAEDCLAAWKRTIKIDIELP